MAVVEFILKARDEATDVVRRVGSELAGLQTNLVGVASAAGPIGLLAAAFVAVGTAVVSAGISLADTSEKLEHSARRTGLSIEQYQLVTKAIEDSGGSADGLGLALQRLNNNIALHNKMVEKLHLDTTDTGTAFMDLIKHVAGAKDQFTATNEAMTLLGRGAGEIIGSAKEIADNFDAVTDRAKKYHTLIGEDSVEATKQLRDNLHDLSAAFGGLWLEFQKLSVGPGTAFIGFLRDAVGALNQFDVAAGEAERSTVGFFEKLFSQGPVKMIGDAFTRAQAAQRGIQLGPDMMPTKPKSAPAAEAEDLLPTLHEILASMEANSRRQTEFFEPTKLRGEGGKGMDASQVLDKLAKAGGWLDKVKESPDALKKFSDQLSAVSVASTRAADAVAANIGEAINALVTGSMTISNVFKNLTLSILASIAEAAAQAGIGMALGTIGSFIPGPIGTFVGKVGTAVGGAHATSGPATGGNTFIIQTISAKDVLQSLVSPTGQMRGANSRLRELAAVS